LNAAGSENYTLLESDGKLVLLEPYSLGFIGHFQVCSKHSRYKDVNGANVDAKWPIYTCCGYNLPIMTWGNPVFCDKVIEIWFSKAQISAKKIKEVSS